MKFLMNGKCLEERRDHGLRDYRPEGGRGGQHILSKYILQTQAIMDGLPPALRRRLASVINQSLFAKVVPTLLSM